MEFTFQFLRPTCSSNFASQGDNVSILIFYRYWARSQLSSSTAPLQGPTARLPASLATPFLPKTKQPKAAAAALRTTDPCLRVSFIWRKNSRTKFRASSSRSDHSPDSGRVAALLGPDVRLKGSDGFKADGLRSKMGRIQESKPGFKSLQNAIGNGK